MTVFEEPVVAGDQHAMNGASSVVPGPAVVAHAERVAQHARRLLVIAVVDVGRRDEELERVVLVRVELTAGTGPGGEVLVLLEDGGRGRRDAESL